MSEFDRYEFCPQLDLLRQIDLEAVLEKRSKAMANMSIEIFEQVISAKLLGGETTITVRTEFNGSKDAHQLPGTSR